MHQGIRIGYLILGFESRVTIVRSLSILLLNDLPGFCGSSGCGEYGKCSFNDTCVCEPGYFGHLCQDMREYTMFFLRKAREVKKNTMICGICLIPLLEDQLRKNQTHRARRAQKGLKPM